jgi:hypothetical protein
MGQISLKALEGKIVHFLGDETMKPRLGIITNVFAKAALAPRSGGYYAVVLWDTDEYIAIEDGKEVICFDSGVSTYPVDSLANKDRFLLANRPARDNSCSGS